MSSGPFHYKRAERLIGLAHDMEDQKPRTGDAKKRDERRVDFMLRRAAIHSRLAAAAAQIELAASMQDDNGVSVEWLEAVQ